MKPITRVFAAVLCSAAATLPIVGCATPETHRAIAEVPRDDAKLLAKLDAEWSAAAGRKDVDAIASFYAPDAVAYPPAEPVAVGYDAVKQVWARYLALPGFAISWKTTHADVSASGELGFTTGTYQLTYIVEAGKLAREVGKYSCIWKKQADGSFKAVHDMWNADAR